MGVIKAISDTIRAGTTELYHRKYFEWGLPARRFIQVNIETNSLCTRKCAHCIFGIMDVPAVRMEAALFFGIIDQLAAMSFRGRVSLFELNEPLTDRRIYDFSRYLSAVLPGCYHLMVTNGDIMTRERLDELMGAGVDLMLVNSYDHESLQKNLSLVSEGALKHGGRVQHVDRTEFSGWESRACHLKDFAGEPFRGFCEYPNHILYVKPDGRVLGCWNDFNGDNVMGRLGERSIEEVWYGEKFQALRRSINRDGRSGVTLCAGCDHRPNTPYMRWNRRLALLKAKNGAVRPPSAKEAREIKEKYTAKTDVEAGADVH